MKITLQDIPSRITVTRNRTTGVMNYDEDNLYPQRILRLVRRSGTATRCVNNYVKYLCGLGFEDEEANNFYINGDGLTPKKLLRMVAFDTAVFNGRSTHMDYTGLAEVSNVHYIPFEYCRLGLKDASDYYNKILFSDDWEKLVKQRKKKPVPVDVFNPDHDTIMSQIETAKGIDKYKGQILYESNIPNNYPLAKCDPIITLLHTDSLMQVFKFRNADNGFNPSVIARYRGKIEAEEERQALSAKLQRFIGPDNTNNAIIIEHEGEEDADLSFERFEMMATDDIYRYTEDTAREEIMRIWNTPRILLGIEEAGKLGGRMEFVEKERQFDKTLHDERDEISEMFRAIFSNWHDPKRRNYNWNIKPLTDYESVSKSVFGRMGEKTAKAVMELIKMEMDDARKVNTLVAVYGMNEAEAKSVLGIEDNG